MNEEIKAVLGKDERMLLLVKKHGLPEAGEPQEIYPYLVESIIYQQLSVKAAAKIFERFAALSGHFPDPVELLELTVEQLRSAGVSAQKAGYLHNIARYFLEEQVQSVTWHALKDEEIMQKLTGIKGVGNWTAKMVLMFGLSRPDVFPREDLGIKMGMKKIYDIEAEGKELITKICNIADKWHPYRSFASKLIWLEKDDPR